MKRSKWLLLNSLLAALAIGAAVVDLIDLSRRGAAERQALPYTVVALLRDEAIARAGATTPADGESGHAGAARTAGLSAHGAGEEPAFSSAPDASLASPERSETRSIAAIADGLGWREPVFARMEAPEQAPTDQPPETSEIPEASWLAFIGTVTQVDGRRFYFFKNDRTGAVMRLSPDRTVDGWSFAVPAAGEYLIEKDGERHRVRRRR